MYQIFKRVNCDGCTHEYILFLTNLNRNLLYFFCYKLSTRSDYFVYFVPAILDSDFSWMFCSWRYSNRLRDKQSRNIKEYQWISQYIVNRVFSGPDRSRTGLHVHATKRSTVENVTMHRVGNKFFLCNMTVYASWDYENVLRPGYGISLTLCSMTTYVLWRYEYENLDCTFFICIMLNSITHK